MLLAVFGFAACENDSIEGLNGEFSDITWCTFDNATVQPTVKLGKGVKALNTQFTDADGHTLALSFRTKDWILGEGTFVLDYLTESAGAYTGSVNGATINDGNIDVNLVEDTTVYDMCPWLAGTIQSIGFANFEYIERPGVHDWAFWKGCYPKFMAKLGKYFK